MGTLSGEIAEHFVYTYYGDFILQIGHSILPRCSETDHEGATGSRHVGSAGSDQRTTQLAEDFRAYQTRARQRLGE